MIMKDITYYWENSKCPIINGIMFADGSVRILNPKEIKQYHYVPEYCGCVSIDELNKKATIDLTTIYKQVTLEITELNLVIYCGEGSWGEEGYIAVCEEFEDKEKLKWIAYFDYSNPMVSLEYQVGKIIAYSNHGHKWIFNLTDPWNVIVEL